MAVIKMIDFVCMEGEIMNTKINQLLEYALKNGMIEKYDYDYSANLLIDLFGINEFKKEEVEDCSIYEILDFMLDYAVEKGMILDTITEKDLLDTRIMNCVMPRPSEVVNTFKSLYSSDPKSATDYFYKLSIDSNYIRKSRIDKNISFSHFCKYGDIQITINLSKPEKDPKEIAKAKNAVSSSYPACLLCKENVGFAGNLNHPARQTHRIIPLDLNGHTYNLQYSPYVYYNEHCIVFNSEHTPMKMDRSTFEHLFAFIDKFPHYMIGSNADLPIVGGSILSHDHYQGGRYHFPMEDAKVVKSYTYKDVQVDMLYWPLSTLRLTSGSKENVIDLATKIFETWCTYSDESLDIIANEDSVRHNTVTPIVRKKDGKYQMDVVLRNNRTTEEYQLGIFHPHSEHHHIKKENIGLIEVMGLAILPARLKTELEQIKLCLSGKAEFDSCPELEKHKDWYEYLKTCSYTNVDTFMEMEVTKKFVSVLENAGVYKMDDEGMDGFSRFVKTLW